MAKYRVLSLISFEFIVEMNSVFHKSATDITIITTYCELSDIPNIRRSASLHSPLSSQPKVAEFMSRKKAEKWLRQYCKNKNIDPVMFELVKDNG